MNVKKTKQENQKLLRFLIKDLKSKQEKTKPVGNVQSRNKKTV